ncbi:helix-turn-helix domain-containing protein [Phenylobacterium sp.]|uniref:helix-turn-helix transcriptional regulator n=1 Tax=Phenylobacterium sp. TaxID=1871053 RepID=UPI00301B9E2F
MAEGIEPGVELMKSEDVAALLLVDEVTLKRWRMENRGPRWIKLGDSQNSPVRYDRAEVNDFLRRRTEGEGVP